MADNFHTQILYFPQESVLYYLYLLSAQRLVLARLGLACYNMVLRAVLCALMEKYQRMALKKQPEC